MYILTRRSSSLAIFKWFSMASKSMSGRAVSILYTSKLAATKTDRKFVWNYYYFHEFNSSVHPFEIYLMLPSVNLLSSISVSSLPSVACFVCHFSEYYCYFGYQRNFSWFAFALWFPWVCVHPFSLFSVAVQWPRMMVSVPRTCEYLSLFRMRPMLSIFLLLNRARCCHALSSYCYQCNCLRCYGGRISLYSVDAVLIASSLYVRYRATDSLFCCWFWSTKYHWLHIACHTRAGCDPHELLSATVDHRMLVFDISALQLPSECESFSSFRQCRVQCSLTDKTIAVQWRP